MEKMMSALSFSKLSYGFQLEEEGRWAGLFHTRVVVRERSCAMMVDHMNLINAASIEMVEKLNLPMTPCPQPYCFRWGHEELTVTQQTKETLKRGCLAMKPPYCDRHCIMSLLGYLLLSCLETLMRGCLSTKYVNTSGGARADEFQRRQQRREWKLAARQCRA
ncbi:hypothetical protein VPH35_020403 [Triticum aestivum]